MNPPELLRILKDLVEHDGWKWLMEVAKSQTHGRTDAIILSPIKSEGAAFEQEYLKGEISGLRLFQAIPDTHIASLSAQLAAQATEETSDDNASFE